MERKRRAAAIQDAGAARDELSLALDDVGVRLPSWGLDSVSLASDDARVREVNRRSTNRP
ncbi:hypothetical protein [Streptomyces coelicoflavus]|uniref:hypothetical protein n=1 Tax=Streptomyces coelicoflavus TaxID=285562 RepID=UPI00362B95C1